MLFFTKKVCIFLCIVLCFIFPLISAQNRCDKACANDQSCSSNQCVLTSCSDTGTCYYYCLKCNDIVTCYAVGKFKLINKLFQNYFQTKIDLNIENLTKILGSTCFFSLPQQNSSNIKSFSIISYIFCLAIFTISK